MVEMHAACIKNVGHLCRNILLEVKVFTLHFYEVYLSWSLSTVLHNLFTFTTSSLLYITFVSCSSLHFICELLHKLARQTVFDGCLFSVLVQEHLKNDSLINCRLVFCLQSFLSVRTKKSVNVGGNAVMWLNFVGPFIIHYMDVKKIQQHFIKIK